MISILQRTAAQQRFMHLQPFHQNSERQAKGNLFWLACMTNVACSHLHWSPHKSFSVFCAGTTSFWKACDSRRRNCTHSPVHQCVLQEGCDGVDVVFAHLSNVFKHEGEGFEHAILDIQLWHTVLIHQGWQHGERRTCLCHNGDSHCCAHTILTLLHLQVVQQCGQNIVGTESWKRHNWKFVLPIQH